MLKARDIMTKDLFTVEANTSLADFSKQLIEKGVSNAPVVMKEEGGLRLIGFISERDCLCAMCEEIFQSAKPKIVSDLMKIHPLCVSPDTNLFTLASIFTQHDFRHLPVVDDWMLKGLVSRRDVLRGLCEIKEDSKSSDIVREHQPSIETVINHRFIVG